MLRVLSLAYLGMMAVSACASTSSRDHSPRPTVVRTTPRSTPVPLLPPDSLPLSIAAQVYAPANVVSGDSVMTGPYPRDVIWLWFNDDATQADRQAAVDSIGGEVIGGAAIRPGGVYYMRIQHDGTTGPLHAAIARLRALPQVRLATPDLSLTTRPDPGGPRVW